MAVIAERGCGSVFATAPFHKLPIGDLNHQRKERGPNMGIVAKWLVFAQAAGAPKIGSGFSFDLYGPESGYPWNFFLLHGPLSLSKLTKIPCENDTYCFSLFPARTVFFDFEAAFFKFT